MNRIPCTYSIVRFLPFVETGEFANIGVVLHSAVGDLFGYRLVRRRARVTQFFEKLDSRVLVSAKENLGHELKRVAQMFRNRVATISVDGAGPIIREGVFQELIRQRESVIQFSEPRGVLADDFDSTLTELFEHYVEHEFATSEYQEKLLERDVRSILKNASLLERFKVVQLGDEAYHATFPFVRVEGGAALAVIKPLDLGQEDSTRILDHAALWLHKVDQLRRRALFPERAMFVLGNAPDSGERLAAAAEVHDSLEERRISVATSRSPVEIVKFAESLN